MGPVVQSVQGLTTGWAVWGSNSGGGEIFRTHPDSGAHPASCSMGTGSFPGAKRPGCGDNHLLPSSAEVENE
jgi:hypothetical protein